MAGNNHKAKSLYFSDKELIERFESWCRHRGIAPGKALQLLIESFIDDLELQSDMMEISLPGKDIRFV